MFENLRILVQRTRFRISSSSRERLWQRIGSLSRSGVPITEALEFLHESRTVGATTSGFIEHQRVAIRSGGFSAAARGWVPKEELIIIEVTQEGDIADGFAQAARIASVRSQLRSTLFFRIDISDSFIVCRRNGNRRAARLRPERDDQSCGSFALAAGIAQRTGIF